MEKCKTSLIRFMSLYNLIHLKAVEIEEDTILYRMHNEAAKRGRNVLSLRASEVVDFSSQYGSNDSISYTAENIVGPPTIFPRTGDSAYSFQLRTYGEWWHTLPSSCKWTVNLPNNSQVESQDFIEFKVEKKIVPMLLRIYEVFNPGAITKILCYCYDVERWVALWQGKPQVLKSDVSNCFSIDIKGVDFLTDYYRIEFHHKHLNYFCEIDGLIIFGEERLAPYFPNYQFPSLAPANQLKKLINCTPPVADISTTSQYPSSYFDALPNEVTHLILSYLDLQSLCIASRVSKLFHKLCYDPVLYKDLNLQQIWHLIDTNALLALQSRFRSLKRLNLAWCGEQGRIPSSYFSEFLEASCTYLTSLKLSNCSFVNNMSMKAISSFCLCLKELELQSCRAKDLTQTGFKYIASMSDLTYLDLYRTLIDKSSIISIIKSLKLEHLLIGSCTNISDINEVAKAIGQYLKYTLRTLDLWRASDLTCLGMCEIAEHCQELVELDLGWCHQIDASCGCIKQLILHCPKLKKLFLTAIRTVSSHEVNSIAKHCPDMEQLDILGTNEVNVAAVVILLQHCTKLKLLDVSYCDTSVKNSIDELQTTFPHVQIKCTSPLNFVY